MRISSAIASNIPHIVPTAIMKGQNMKIRYVAVAILSLVSAFKYVVNNDS